MGISEAVLVGRRSSSVEADEGLAGTEDELAVNELLLSARGVAEGGVGQAVDLAQGALGELMQRGEGVVGKRSLSHPAWRRR